VLIFSSYNISFYLFNILVSYLNSRMRLETDKGKSSSEVGTWNHRGIYDLRESKLLQSTLLLNVYKNNSFGYYRLSNPHVFHVLNNLACAV